MTATRGWLEEEVSIGDIWAWGDARLQVSQPRFPCYKLATVTGCPDILKRVVQSGRTGWYLQVLQPGLVPVAGPIHLVQRDPPGVSVSRVHRAMFSKVPDRAEIEAVAKVDALASSWHDWLRDQLDGA